MIDPGSVAIGALCIIALMAGFVGYLFRGHRIDATGLKVVKAGRPWLVVPGPEKIDEKPEDFFEMAKERDPE